MAKPANTSPLKPNVNPPSTPIPQFSSRSSLRSDEETNKVADSSALNVTKGDDSIPSTGIPLGVGTEGKVRITRSRLEEIERILSDRDLNILMYLKKYRFLTTDQLCRLFFYKLSPSSRSRSCHYNLKRLKEAGLISALSRRIGGGKGGSSQTVWRISNAGDRLLHLHVTGKYVKKSFKEPSAVFLSHTLAVAECALQIITICRNSHELELTNVTVEPDCWRPFIKNGKAIHLKPDLSVVTTLEDYEDRWFIEIDLSTESPGQIVNKCRVYRDYYLSGIEQQETGIFPLVVWIVVDEKRKERLKDYIRQSLPSTPKMFLVITDVELEKMLRQQIESEELC